MKLVEILSRELVEWPDLDGEFDVKFITQDASAHVESWEDDGQLLFTDGEWRINKSVPVEGGIVEHSELAKDHATAIVTREMWEAERARIQCNVTMHHVDHDGLGGVVERAAPQWNGEGLPPVGVIVLNRHGEKRRVVAHDGDTVVCATGAGGYRGYTPSEQADLRQIRTPREKWIEAADNAIGHGLSLHGKLGALYDAGLAMLPEGGE